MYYSSGNYEAFARPKKPAGIDHKSASIVGPLFDRAVRDLHAALDETEAHPNVELTARDELWMGYTAALALEMYLAGARDGGRVHHAFVTGELPDREIQERKGEKWDDATDA